MQQIESRESKKIRRIYGIKKELVITLIKEYAHNTKMQISQRNYKTYFKKLNSSYSIEAIRVLMIREIKMNYKRVKSRPNSFD